MKILRSVVSLLVVAAVSMASTAHATLSVFAGFDVGANSTDSHPGADDSAATFDQVARRFGLLQIVNFESSPVGNFSGLLVAPGVTVLGSDFSGDSQGQSIRDTSPGTPDRLYGYNTTLGGHKFSSLNGGSLTFVFSTPIWAFGAYITGAQVTGQRLVFDDGVVQNIYVPTDLTDGGASFIGFIDPGRSITSVTLTTVTPDFSAGDIVGIDDIRFVLQVPEPATVALMLGGLLLMAPVLRRRRSHSA